MAPSCALGRLIIVLSFLCFQVTHQLIDSFTETYWQSPLQVFEYKSYRSVRILEFTVPPQTVHVAWLFHGLMSQEGCEERNIEVALQHGSYPVITPHNETFPPHFNTQRTELSHVQLRTNGTRVLFTPSNPLPGHWFAAMYLLDKADNRIKQKGFSKSCQYFLGSTQEVNVLEHITGLQVGENVPLDVSNISIYRFHSTELTWQYRLNITDCSFTPNIPENSTASNRTFPDCPLLVAVRGLTLAGWNNESMRVNCSQSWDGSNCSLVVTSPETNDWQYLMFDADIPGTIHFKVFIDISECRRYGSRPPGGGGSPTAEPPVNVSAEPATNSSDSPPSFSVKKSLPFPAPKSIISHSTVTVYNLSQETGAPDVSANLNLSYSSADKGLSPSQYLQLTPTKSPEVGERAFNECTRIPQLGRFSRTAFDVQYSLRLGSEPFPNQLLIPSDQPLVLAFKVKSMQDNGGTLKYQLDLLHNDIQDEEYSNVEVVSCIQRGRIPMGESGVHCDPANQLTINMTDVTSRRVYFPYPESGTWYITLLSRCYINGSMAVRCRALSHAGVGFILSISPCVDAGCGLYGRCREYFSGVLHFSACACTANWRGYGCTDGTVAESDALQLAGTLLLSLSNLAFIPAIIVALYRHFFVEALVYTYTMFFSTFYHACDGDSRHVWCMMPYNVLAHCDFFGAILSFWVTLVAMARLPERARSFLLVLAALALAMGVQWDRHSLWTFLVPSATGLGVMLSTWSYRCHKRKECYPTKWRWLFYIAPGALIAISGLITFAFFETSRNYKFTHSVWHACMALCIVFILPPRRFGDKDVTLHGGTPGMTSSACCVSLSRNSDQEVLVRGNRLSLSGADNASFELGSSGTFSKITENGVSMPPSTTNTNVVIPLSSQH